MVAKDRKSTKPEEPKFSEEAEVVEQDVNTEPSQDHPDQPAENEEGFHSVAPTVEEKQLLPLEVVVQQVLNGTWGNSAQRKHLLTEAGYNYDEIQSEVNRRMGGGAPYAHKPSVFEVARGVKDGHWGEGAHLRRNLEGAGYNYDEIMSEVERRKTD